MPHLSHACLLPAAKARHAVSRNVQVHFLVGLALLWKFRDLLGVASMETILTAKHQSLIFSINTSSASLLQQAKTSSSSLLLCVQVASSLRNKLLLKGAENLGAQGFLDTAQDLITKHQASVDADDIQSLTLQLRLRVQQVNQAVDSN